MSFILGVTCPRNQSAATVARMQAFLPIPGHAWRGCSSTSAAFGIALSSDLPEDIFDRQPLQSEALVLVGDVRIDNRLSLAASLGWDSARLQASADSELFLAAWLRWGKRALDQVVGGFAAAVWDERERVLTLIRDHVGERPLYYLQSGQTIAFASLPLPLRQVPGVDTSLNEARLVHYVSLAPWDASESFFKNIRIVPVGHILVFRDGVATLSRYWHPLDAPQLRFKKDSEYVEAFREQFDRAVGARLRTTGGVGSQLSGGMDSSSVTATAARLLGEKTLTSFTAVPDENFAEENPIGRFGDEGPAAARVAAMHSNIQHILVRTSSEDIVTSLQHMGRLQGHPVFNPTNHLWFKAILDQSRSRGIKVMLQGACGNATLSSGGLIGLSVFLRRGQPFKLARLVRQLHRRGHVSWRGAASFAVGSFIPKWLRRRLSREQETFSFAFSPVHPAQAAQHHLIEKTREEFFANDNSVEDFRRQMFDYYDTGFVNGATSLGWDIALRDPTQDKRIFEFCFSIPIEQYLVGGQTRSLVRRAMRGHLPDSTLDCTTRGLQSADWFLTVGAQLKRLEEELHAIKRSDAAERLLDLDRLDKLLHTWPSGGYELDEISDSYGLALLRGLSAGNFIRQFE